VGFGSLAKVTGILPAERLSLSQRHGIESAGSFVAKNRIIELDCYRVRHELVNWMEGDLSAELRAQVDHHLQNCQHCTAVYHGARNVVRLLGNDRAIDLPEGFSRRLYERLFRAR